MSQSTSNPPTWGNLVAHEPRLAALLSGCQQVKDIGGRYFCRNRLWYGNGKLKSKMCQLVGTHCNHPVKLMHTSAAYDVALDTLYYALPPCRDCPCFYNIGEADACSELISGKDR